jgi:2-haloacid dehalogenase
LGASAAGWKTALILRPGNAPLRVGGQPLITGDHLGEVTDMIFERYVGPPASTLPKAK